jgi:transcriptional regulator with XRE-family HTH domain
MKVYLKTNFIQKKLIRKNKPQNWLADKFGISTGYLSQLMDGSRQPSPKLRTRILSVFRGYEFDDLFVIKEKKKS